MTLSAIYDKFPGVERWQFLTSCQRSFPTCTISGSAVKTKYGRQYPSGRPSKPRRGGWINLHVQKTSSPPQHKELAFHFEAIDYLVQQIVAHEAAWWQYFDAYNIQPFTVLYEELSAAYEATALNILRYLHISIPEKSDVCGAQYEATI